MLNFIFTYEFYFFKEILKTFFNKKIYNIN